MAKMMVGGTGVTSGDRAALLIKGSDDKVYTVATTPDEMDQVLRLVTKLHSGAIKCYQGPANIDITIGGETCQN